MDAARWKRIQTIVDAALPLPRAEHEQYVTSVCGNDASLRADVLALLASIDASESFWEEWSAWNAGVMEKLLEPRGEEAYPATPPPRRLGAWRIDQELGRGGMGTVFRAERADGLFEQQAAAKLMQRGLLGDAVGRFNQERQILARLDHPNIARLYDGGFLEDGRPWLVMEFVDGVPITTWCRQHEAPLAQRLDLFRQVCEAVRFAHRNLIVHRDLKPDNILVSQTPDAQLRIKVLDFGIAKLVDEETAADRHLTRTGVRVMSLDYAAPEQIAGEPVTTATDVYTLGLLLYELLTDAYPFRLEGKSLRQIEHVLRDVDPPPPSTHRTTWRHDLRGDLDAIAGKALRKEPEERYESAAQLLEDLVRYHRHLPVIARRDTLRYRLSKFSRRYARPLAAAAAVLLLIGGLTVYHSVRVTQERNLAQREAAKSEQVSAFLVELFEASDPFLSAATQRPDTLTIRHILDRGAERIRDELSDQPDVQARMLHVVGDVYRSLGLYDAAVPLLEEAVDIERRYRGVAGPAVAEHLHVLAQVYHQLGKYDEAADTLSTVLEIQRTAGASQGTASARARAALALVLRDQGRYDEATQLLHEALAIQREHLGSAHADVARSLDGLGNVYHLRSDLPAAEAVYRESLELHRELWGDAHPNYAQALLNMATLMREKGVLDEAEALLREALDIRTRVLGEKHPLTTTATYELAMLLRDRGELAQAAEGFRQVIDRDERLLGADHHYVGLDHYELGITLSKLNDAEGAERAYRNALSILRNTLPAGHPTIAHVLNGLGYHFVLRGEPARGEPLLQEAVDLYRAALGDSSWRMGVAMSGLGHAYMDLHYPEAESLLIGGYDVLRRSGGPVRAALERLVRYYEYHGDEQNAAAYQELLADAPY